MRISPVMITNNRVKYSQLEKSKNKNSNNNNFATNKLPIYYSIPFRGIAIPPEYEVPPNMDNFQASDAMRFEYFISTKIHEVFCLMNDSLPKETLSKAYDTDKAVRQYALKTLKEARKVKEDASLKYDEAMSILKEEEKTTPDGHTRVYRKALCKGYEGKMYNKVTLKEYDENDRLTRTVISQNDGEYVQIREGIRINRDTEKVENEYTFKHGQLSRYKAGIEILPEGMHRVARIMTFHPDAMNGLCTYIQDYRWSRDFNLNNYAKKIELSNAGEPVSYIEDYANFRGDKYYEIIKKKFTYKNSNTTGGAVPHIYIEGAVASSPEYKGGMDYHVPRGIVFENAKPVKYIRRAIDEKSSAELIGSPEHGLGDAYLIKL